MEKKESTEKTSCSKQKMENLNKGKTQRQVKLEETDHKNEEKKKTGEGDSNSKYFHIMVNWRRRKNLIRGVSRDGIWIEDQKR